MKESQREEILAWLKAGNTITPLFALEKFGCFRLGARCWELKKAGHKIETEMIEDRGKRYARYRLVG